MRRLLCTLSTSAMLGATLLAGASLLSLSGCGGNQGETGTTVEVSDQMLKDAEASDAYYMEQQQQAKGKRPSGN